ncbi:MAG: nucleoside kinase [Lachnospiraceae bacterium]|nr:nucleoside kinase [Lachnospiraceae bacterium]
MKEEAIITYRGEQYSYPRGISYMEIAEEFQKNYDYPIVLARVNNKLKELFHVADGDIELEFETIDGHIGHKTYKRGVCMLFLKSFYDVVGRDKVEKLKIGFSMGPGYYCTAKGKFILDKELVSRVKKRMMEVVEKDVPIVKKKYSIDEVRKKCRDVGMRDKERLFHYRMSSDINMYILENYVDYFYGFMVPSTGYLSQFDLQLYKGGMILQMVKRGDPDSVPPIKDMPSIFETMEKSVSWSSMLGVETVGALNDSICEGRITDIVLAQEALVNSRISEIAEEISKRKSKFITIAGPSSSGKTTFSHRLGVQLLSHGLHPRVITLDNYYLGRERVPLAEDGTKNFEALESLDLDEFNSNMKDLLAGQKVVLPSYNFLTGVKEYYGNPVKLGTEDVVVVEGIHGLSDEIAPDIAREQKFKIYISSLTTMNIDEHNRISTTDGRLIRRIVRDYMSRGTSAERTLSMWSKVRRGEEENIFPLQEKADAIFNSALVYEISVLKQFVEPLLYSIKPNSENYQEALRLLKFLQYFLGLDASIVPSDSLIREFIGGSCYM